MNVLPQGRAEGLHDDRPGAAEGGAQRDRRPAEPARATRSSAIVTIDPRTATSARWPRAAPTRTATSTWPRRATASPARRSRRSCWPRPSSRASNPTTTYYDVEAAGRSTPDGTAWKVKTFGGDYLGHVNLAQATLHSDNTVYAQLDLDLGPKNVAETAQGDGHHHAPRRLPGRGPRRPAARRLAARDGRRLRDARRRRRAPQAGRDHEGRVPRRQVGQPRAQPEGNRVLTDGEAYEVTKILHQNVLGGTGTRANIGCPAAGKTGTTDNFNDAWFVGYTPQLAPRPSGSATRTRSSDAERARGRAEQGGSFPAQIWHDYMNIAKGSYCGDFPPPTHGRALGRRSSASTPPPARTGRPGPSAHTGPKTNGGRPPTQGLRPAPLRGAAAGAPEDPGARSPRQPSSGGRRTAMATGGGYAPRTQPASDGRGAAPWPHARGRWPSARSACSTCRSPRCRRRPGSKLVLATVGGSPGWLLGPLRFAGLSAADGRLAGPLFYAGLWLALALYVVVLVRARDLPARSVLSGRSPGCTSSSCWRRRCCRRTCSRTSPTRGWAWSTR